MPKKPEIVESKVDQIVREAEERLNRFYAAYGENVKGLRKKEKKEEKDVVVKLSSNPPPKTKSKPKIIYRPVNAVIEPEDYDYIPPTPKPPTELPKREAVETINRIIDEVPVIPRKIVSDREVTVEEEKNFLLREIFRDPTEEEKTALSNKLSEAFSKVLTPDKVVDLTGLTSREIINKVKDLTGELITICVKSKINVIRHAKIILEKKGFTTITPV